MEINRDYAMWVYTSVCGREMCMITVLCILITFNTVETYVRACFSSHTEKIKMNNREEFMQLCCWRNDPYGGAGLEHSSGLAFSACHI